MGESSFGFGLSTLMFPPYPVAYYNAPAVQHDDLIQHQMWNELSWGKASDDGDEDRRRSGFFDGAISFPPPSSSVDPPRPARVGFEWVWFPEGYWAERQTPAVRPRRRHASSISSRLSGRRKATVQSADNDAPKPESPKTPYLSETDLVVSLQNPSPENPGRSWRRGSGFRMSEPEATVHSTPSDQESEGSPGKHRSRSKKAAKFMRDVLTMPISSRRNSKLSYKSTGTVRSDDKSRATIEGATKILEAQRHTKLRNSARDVAEKLRIPRKAFGVAPWHRKGSPGSVSTVTSSVRDALSSAPPPGTPDLGRNRNQSRVPITDFPGGEATRIKTPPSMMVTTN